MIGNDVVDIIQSRHESNWQRKGFLEKLFTVSEQSIIAQSAEPEMMVWLLWSMKEAAYKIYNRQTKIREYIPKKLVCTISSKNNNYIFGQVICGENSYHTKTTIAIDNFLHTIAVTRFDDLNHILEIEKKSIIKNENGIPYLQTQQNIVQDVSISHHGRFEKVVIIDRNH
jgi:hypothetical protein